MSMLVMAHPVPHMPFQREFNAWDEARQTDYTPRAPRNDLERIALPSIRETFPEIQYRLPEINTRVSSQATSPIAGPGGGAMTPPEYVHSPNTNKRRRLSIGDEREERASQVPRLYTSPPVDPALPGSRGMSPTTYVPRSATDSWTSSTRTSPYMPQSAGSLGGPMRSPVTMEAPERVDSRPTLPSLPHLNFDREPAPMPRIRGHSTDEGHSHAPRPMMMHPNSGPAMDGGAYRHGSGYQFTYHHPSRVQSLSLGAIHPLDRSPFSAAGYGPHYQEYGRHYEFGGLSMNGDNKQRKRRGNLPKETTDKLRAWFMANLNHPYPTEDQKQELMRQTGLQMNQISNWFINARRRQLPTMINNAQAASDAMSSARSVDGKVLPTTERGEYDEVKHRDSAPLSDCDSNVYDDSIENLKRRHAVGMKRGSV